MTTQFKKGVIEICVLKIISKKDMYGFEIIDELSEKLQINENTIYPLLRRLTAQKLFETYQQETSNGAPRKYYKITEKGKRTLEKYLQEWQTFIYQINQILGGNNEN